MSSHSTDPKLLRPFPELPVPEERVTYEKSRSKSEFFLKVMEVMYRPFEEGQEIPSLADIWREHIRGDEPDMADLYEPISEMPTETAEKSTPEDLVQRFISITGALGHLQTVFPEDHPDITNLRDALHEILGDPEAMSKLESLVGEVGPSKVGTGDPYTNDLFEEAEQLFDQQVQSIESAFDEPMFESSGMTAPQMFDEQAEMMFEQLPEETLPETESLEQIVEQEDPFASQSPVFMEQDMMPDEMTAGMDTPGAMPGLTLFDIDPAIDEISQAIDEVTQQVAPEEVEPDPFQPLYDPYMMGQNIFDQMQYMVDPFAMPGPYGPTPGPMGPMGAGPMGPMPGPMPGP